MKRSHHIQVAALSMLGMAACSTKETALPDPCQPESYNDIACQDSVKNGGYYSHAVFVYHYYPDPYMSYYQRYQAFTAKGGVPHASPAEGYSAEGAVSRGGFGESAHGAEAGE